MKFFQNKIFRILVTAAIGVGIYYVTPPCFEKTYLISLLILLFILINASEFIARITVLTTISRLLVGGLFIFSGFIKANDPIGFSYKLEEYFEVFAAAGKWSFFVNLMEWMKGGALPMAVLICIVEVVLGFMMLIGSKIKTTLWLILLMIVFFTFLTFYSACYNKVTDCGCFGDFLHLKPWESFWKDIILLVLIVIVFVGRNNIAPLFRPKWEQAILVLIVLVTAAFPIYTYNFLPVLDFRPYKIGTNIKADSQGTPDELKYFYILKEKATGKTEKFDHWPAEWDKKYDYVDNKPEVIKQGIPPKIHDFSISSIDGGDFTEDFLTMPGYHFFLIAYDLDKTNKDETVQGHINDFAALCEKDSISFIGLTASGPEKVKDFRHEVQAIYAYYNTDGTVLKTMIRSNPGLMLLKDGVVVDMWHYHSFPSYNEVKAKYFKK